MVSSGAIRYEVGLARNAYGALTAVADSAVAPGVRSRDAAFEYDLAGRLVAAEVSEHHFEYAYDAPQNMTRREMVVVPGGAITPDLLSGDYRHGDAATGKRRLQQVTMPGTSTALATFSYDLAGRMTRVGLSAATDTTMAFDAFDRVRVVDEPGSGLTQHRYDAAGERATTVWADGRIERYFGGGLTQREGRLELHVGLGGARVVARVNVPELPDGTASISDGLGGAPAVVYLHQGVGHGPTVVTDASGEVIEERVFEPYGTPLWVDADYELERLGWNGKVVDPSTGWSDHGARWHATRFARWLSVDPPLKGPGGLVEHGLMATPYGFVAGNPVMFWDPDGKQPGPQRVFEQFANLFGRWGYDEAPKLYVDTLASITVPFYTCIRHGDGAGCVVDALGVGFLARGFKAAKSVDAAETAVMKLVSEVELMPNKSRPAKVAALVKDGEVIATGYSQPIPGKPRPPVDKLTDAEVRASMDALGDEAPGYSTKCAEIWCLSWARGSDIDVRDAILDVREVLRPGKNGHGGPVLPCPTCKGVLPQAGVRTRMQALSDIALDLVVATASWATKASGAPVGGD